jgi:uncharacterized protein (DUF1501 family)
MACLENMILNRRTLLKGGAASLALWSFLPKTAIAGTRDPRLLAIVLRGGLDGLALCAPVGDPDYVRLRANIALAKEGAAASLPLDSMFALNPNMPFLHGLYQKREAFIAHAVHTPYRERSHFDGQDVLESGLPGTGKKDDGWLNRALEELPHAGTTSAKGLAMGAVVPLVMRGRAPVLSWIPKVYSLPLRESTVARLMDLYAHTDPALAKALLEGVEINRVAEAEAATPAAGPKAQQSGVRSLREFTDAAEAAARFLSAADGPRIGALSYNGWDTHANEGVVQGQLGNRLAGLDAAIQALHDGLGSAWKETVLIIVTEFGRTVRVNGTQGTDHGMATVALFAGGAVNGGRVLADWPGLSEANLYERRDLKPTTDLRALIKGVLKDHLAIPDGALASAVFPGSTAVKAADGLIV